MMNRKAVGGAMLAAMSLAAANASADPTRVPLDQETSVGGVGVACTGIGQTKNDPKWLAYPARVEFAGPGGEYLANETLTVSDAKGGEVLAVSCEGPWILLKLPPGKTFKVDGQVEGAPAVTVSAKVRAPSHGQARFVLRFPDVSRSPE